MARTMHSWQNVWAHVRVVAGSVNGMLYARNEMGLKVEPIPFGPFATYRQIQHTFRESAIRNGVEEL
jgi:hypothetical protein